METLFENNYTKDEKLLKEFYSYYYFKRPFEIVLSIILILLIIKNIIDFAIYGYLDYFTIFIILFYFIFKIIYYNYFIRILLKREYELNKGKPLEVNTIVTDEFIQNKSSNGAVNEITFDKLKKGFQTKNLILFRSNANLIYIFRKDTFSKGTKEEFIKFIKSKGIKIK